MLNKKSYTAVKLTSLNVWDISFCSSLGGRGHYQQQPCWNKMIPRLFPTIYKQQQQQKIQKEEEKCPVLWQCENAKSYFSTST